MAFRFSSYNSHFLNQMNKYCFLLILAGIALIKAPIYAQIAPDKTLGTESSLVNPIDGNNDRIDGGASRGSNLFHSFRDFNVGEGRGVYFANPEGITNVLSRVTGGNPSNILGKLGVLGNANLFLLNPNGILFGSNASLNLNGAFLATSANTLLFTEGQQWSMANGSPSPLLSVTVPIGLGFNKNPGSIVVEGDGHNLSVSTNPVMFTEIGPSTSTLETVSKSSISLLGGEVLLDGGVVKAPSSKIEVGAVASGQVFFPQGLKAPFDYSYAKTFQDIVLTNSALLDAGGDIGGRIALSGKSVYLTNGSYVLIRAGFGSFLSSIDVNAQDRLLLQSDQVNVNKPFGRRISVIVSQNFLGEGVDINLSS